MQLSLATGSSSTSDGAAVIALCCAIFRVHRFVCVLLAALEASDTTIQGVTTQPMTQRVQSSDALLYKGAFPCMLEHTF